jgi:hypothetical protein
MQESFSPVDDTQAVEVPVRQTAAVLSALLLPLAARADGGSPNVLGKLLMTADGVAFVTFVSCRPPVAGAMSCLAEVSQEPALSHMAAERGKTTPLLSPSIVFVSVSADGKPGASWRAGHVVVDSERVDQTIQPGHPLVVAVLHVQSWTPMTDFGG